MTSITRATDISRFGNKLKAPQLRNELSLWEKFMEVRAKPPSQDWSVCLGHQAMHYRRHGVSVKLKSVS